MPRRGNPGGLMGLRRVPSSVSASGVWDSDEQSLAKRAGIWPNTPINAVPVESITYSQSTVYGSTSAATVTNMTDGLLTGDQTATNISGFEFIKMDLGALCNVNRVVIGTASASHPPGGWHQSYTNDCDLHYSTDNSNWTFIVNTGELQTPQMEAPKLHTVSFSTVQARYIRISKNSYIALTEFYALSPGQTFP